MADTDSIRKSIKKLEKKGVVVDENGNVINMKSYKVRTNRQKSVYLSGKRGRPRTRPERTTPKRKYERSFKYTKEEKAKAKALRDAKRAEKAMLGKTYKVHSTSIFKRKAGKRLDKAYQVKQMGLAKLAAAGIPGAIPAGGRGIGKPQLPVVSGPFS